MALTVASQELHGDTPTPVVPEEVCFESPSPGSRTLSHNGVVIGHQYTQGTALIASNARLKKHSLRSLSLAGGHSVKSATVGIRPECRTSISEWQLPGFENQGFLKEVTSKPEIVRGLRESVVKGLPG